MHRLVMPSRMEGTPLDGQVQCICGIEREDDVVGTRGIEVIRKQLAT